MGLDENMRHQILTCVCNKVEKLFIEVKMPESHGLKHVKTVLGHMERAIETTEASMKKHLTPEKLLTLRMAALLHEADDHKYFPDSKDFDNARKISDESIPDTVFNKNDLISDVCLMISMVSASVNGNSVPDAAKADPTLLWPRYCDRLEAIGIIGAVRCYQYNCELGDPLMLDTTPRPRTEEEVWECVQEERWTRYQTGGGSSVSMMDHYYDKLLHIAKFDINVIRNPYLVEEAKKRVQPLVDVCIESGKTGQAPVGTIKKLEQSLKSK